VVGLLADAKRASLLQALSFMLNLRTLLESDDGRNALLLMCFCFG
jgi:hypothetical protein